jgi:hypothetical protein
VQGGGGQRHVAGGGGRAVRPRVRKGYWTDRESNEMIAMATANEAGRRKVDRGTTVKTLP